MTGTEFLICFSIWLLVVIAGILIWSRISPKSTRQRSIEDFYRRHGL